jgi:acylphosphatase
MRTLHLHVEGRVQGVGYRASLMNEALRHGLRGWVRNRRDGSVEAVLHGPVAACDAVAAWARRGPPAAHVTRVLATALESDPLDLPAGFECRPTA